MASKSSRARLTGSGLRLRRGFGAGAAINTNITITGIKVGDEIVSAYKLVAGVPTTDVTAEMKITAANTVQCTTTASGGNVIDVIWLSR